MKENKTITDTYPMIYEKISNIMGSVGVISKDRKNTQGFGYSYRGIDDMYNVLNEHLVNNGVFFTTNVIDIKRETKKSNADKDLQYTILTAKFTFFAKDGSFVESTMVGEAMDSGDKSTNKAISAACKYALMEIFCIPTEEIKDTEAETHVVKWTKIKKEDLDGLLLLDEEKQTKIKTHFKVSSLSELTDENYKFIISQLNKQK